MSKVANILTTAVVCCCLAGSALTASQNEASALPGGGRQRAAESVLTCYRTVRDPHTVVCYRVSRRPLHKGADIVFVPFLVQVPTPADHPPAALVDTLPST